MITLNYENRVVFISGAGGGMGQLAAIKFAEANAILIITDIDKAALNNTETKLSSIAKDILALSCDVAQENSVKLCIESAIKKHGRIDIAINNAGILQNPARLDNIEATEFQNSLDINATGVFWCMKYLLKCMKDENQGVILNMASAAGVIGAPYMAAYAAAKHAVIGMTKTAALEYARYNIRINALCPSYVDSPMVDAFTGNTTEQLEKLSHAIPMKRLANMDEIVNNMLWLCSDYNTYMTGQAISIDGGLTAG